MHSNNPTVSRRGFECTQVLRLVARGRASLPELDGLVAGDVARRRLDGVVELTEEAAQALQARLQEVVVRVLDARVLHQLLPHTQDQLERLSSHDRACTSIKMYTYTHIKH